ncbi:hypothetical protein KY348_02060 [Candidatus Woesearchaeota archaeon]|nr:hypothetical protein [Candidatus Woesearchaeota archaeon]
MRKAQAALEFLTTYGWAFLVILIMIGALAYFGVLNPPALLPSRCTFGPEVACLEHRINASDTTLEFRFRNNVGQGATFVFNAIEIASDELVPCVNSTGGSDFTLRAGRLGFVLCDFSTTSSVFILGDKIKFEMEASYTKEGGSYSTPVKGEVYGEAQ